MVRITQALGFIATFLVAHIGYADILPAGHKSVTHKIVFQDSELLDSQRLIAAPISGLKGTIQVVPGEAFHFSSKYQTRFYLVPNSVEKLPGFDRNLYRKWTALEPPVAEIRSAPRFSPIASALTTVQLITAVDGEPAIKLVDHKVFNQDGQVIAPNPFITRGTFYFAAPVFIGVVFLAFAIGRRFIRPEPVAPHVS